MKQILFTVLLLPAVASTQTLETSIVTDWETVQHYGSVEATRDKIMREIAYADSVVSSYLDIDIEVTYIEIPESEEQDALPGHTHAKVLLEALFDYRITNENHYYADTTMLLTHRDLRLGSRNLGGFAYIGSICGADSLSTTEFIDNGLDGETIAHELGHVLGAVHDGEPPCEDTPSYGYIMSPNLYSGNSYFSQCSIDTIKAHLEIYGGCLYEQNVPTQTITPIPEQNGGGGTMSMLFIQVLLLIVVFRMWVANCWMMFFLQSKSFPQSATRNASLKFWAFIVIMIYLVYLIIANIIGML